jgi:hypothetical protein
MYLEDMHKPGYFTVRMKCDECGQDYNAKVRTVWKQETDVGHHQCKCCSSRRAGKNTFAKTGGANLIYGKEYLRRPDIWKKISKSKSGIAFTEDHKKALRKPKSKTDKIIEAANRPEERERRSRLMVERLLSDKHRIGGIHEYVATKKTKEVILCRSKLEARFLRKIDDLDCVVTVESAEKLRLPYIKEGCIHHYLPDFLLHTKNGDIIVEMKGTNRINSEDTKKKIEILENFCRDNKCSFAVLTERTMHKWLEQLKK